MVLLAGTAIGCSRHAEIVLHQPFAPPSQQNITLKSRWAFSSADSQHRGYLLEFPLPGGNEGPRDFHIYMTASDLEGERTIVPEDPDAPRGFLIQDVGRLRGKTEFTAGTIRCRRLLLRPRLRRLDLDVRCADGTSISGKAYVEIDARELGRFEHEFAADINELRPGEGESDEPAETTTPRNTQSR